MSAQKANSFAKFNQASQSRNQSMCHLFWWFKRFTSQFIEPRLQALGFSDFKMSYLIFLAKIDERGTTNSDLAKQACVTKQMMSKTVSLLEEEGYIYTRKKVDDSRSSLIFLSDRGQALFVQLESCMQELRNRFDAIVGPDCMDQVIDTMAELVNELEKVERCSEL